jgi:hypothetical protein
MVLVCIKLQSILVKYTVPITTNRLINAFNTLAKPFANPKSISVNNFLKKIDEDTPVIALIAIQPTAKNINFLLPRKSIVSSLFKVPFLPWGARHLHFHPFLHA